jgi:hypothetical protein
MVTLIIRCWQRKLRNNIAQIDRDRGLSRFFYVIFS